jgi:glycosyltransferase involved in cell wall biosynthesis
MKLLYLTAGAGGMYCGSCLRDNALAAGLMAEGHDVTLLPLYMPTLTDEENVSRPEVFFGGISVYLEQHSALFRRTPKWLDRLWDSAFALRLASRRSIAVDPAQLGELTVSMLKGRAGNQGKELAKLLDWLTGQETPDAVTLQNSMLIALAAPIRKALQRPVVCTLQGEDLFLDGLSEPYRAEALRLIRENVAHVDAFIAVSDFYADFMADYLAIPREKIHVVPLGINCDGFEANGRGPGGDFVVGYFGRIAPEKGLHLLAEAYRLLRERGALTNSKLEAAGWLGAENKAYLGGVERRMKEWGLGDEFRYRGALDRQGKVDFLRRLSVFSMPATYAEPKGLSVLEAMAAGVPVVEPRHGSFPEIVERTGGGVLCAPNNAASLAEAISSLHKNPELAADLGRRGARGVREHYTVRRMAERALEVYGAVI